MKPYLLSIQTTWPIHVAIPLLPPVTQVLVEQNGKTHYFEYGRYPNGNQPTSDGAIREAATPDVQRDASGNITPDSMNNLLQSLSNSSGSVEALVIPTTSGEE